MIYRTLTNGATSVLLVSGLCAGVVASAFVTAPIACEGGFLPTPSREGSPAWGLRPFHGSGAAAPPPLASD